MKDPRMLTVEARGEREIVMTRAFDAPRPLVFDAFTKPEYVSKWLLGPPGWTMPVCEIDLKVGGRYRYVWEKESKGERMGVSGVFREVAPPARVVHTERFDEAWYEGEAVITTEFADTGAGTSVTMTMLLVSKEARDGVLKSGMESGVAVSYDRLAGILDAPAVLRTEARPAAVIRLTVPRADMPKVMGPAIGEIMAALAAQGVARGGAGLRASPEDGSRHVRLRGRNPRRGPSRPPGASSRRAARRARRAEGLHGAVTRGSAEAWGRSTRG